MGNKNSNSCDNSFAKSISENELSSLVKRTSFTREQILECHFRFGQMCCQRGEIEKKQFIEYLRQVRPDKNLEVLGAQIFNAFDSNKNGRIDFNEFLIATALTCVNDPQQRLRFVFKMYDLNGDNKLDVSEVEKIILGVYDFTGQKERKGKKAPRELAKSLLRRYDKDDSGFLTEEEFVSGIADPTLQALDYFDILRIGNI